MPLRLQIKFGNTTHRFVKTTKVTLSLAGPPEPELKGSVLGNHLFAITDVSLGNTFILKIEIPAPNAAISKPVLSLQQSLEVIRLPSGALSLRPNPASTDNRFKGAFHPRLDGQLINAGTGNIYQLDVDLNFLNLRPEHVLAVNSAFMDEYLRSTPAIAGASPHYDCRLRLFEFTGGKPSLWPVLIPLAVKDDLTRINAILFFRPAGKEYTNIDDANSLSVMRYLLDPPAAHPFFVDPTRTVLPVDPVASCGFERQLSEAGKAVVLVTPNPHGGDYGKADGANWPDVMKSLVKAMWGEDAVGKAVTSGLAIGKVAVGAFSMGGLSAFSCAASHPASINELYLFDCRNFSKTDRASVKTWFKLGGKKLRMIGGGLFHTKMLDLAAELKSSDVSVTPTSVDAWVTNTLYQSAVKFVSFDPATAAAATARGLSTTGLFLVGSMSSPAGIQFQGRDSVNKVVVGSRDFPGFGANEAASGTFLYAKLFTSPNPKAQQGLIDEFAKHDPPEKPPKVPLDSEPNFTALLRAVGGRCRAVRHQWAVCGGDDSAGKTDRGSTFKGFLHQCLEKSGMP